MLIMNSTEYVQVQRQEQLALSEQYLLAHVDATYLAANSLASRRDWSVRSGCDRSV